MIAREAIVAEARSWIGTPYVHQHRARGHGVDCVGLVIGVGINLGIFAAGFDFNGYARTPDGKSMLAECERHMVRVPVIRAQVGDVMVFAFEKAPHHMGFLGDYPAGGLSLIHALGTTDGKGSVIEWRLTAIRKGWLPVAAFSLPGVA